MEIAKSRELLMVRARKQLEEIRQYFFDGEHWNRTHPTEEIELDPTGELRILEAGLERMLEKNSR